MGQKNEESKYLEKLCKESALVRDIITKEDWEIDRSIHDFVVKNKGKNKIKRIANYLHSNLK